MADPKSTIHFPAGRRVRSIPFTHGFSTSAFVRPFGLAEPVACLIARDVEGATFGVAHERHASVLTKTACLREVDADTVTSRCQVCVDLVSQLAVEPCAGNGFVARRREADEGYPHGCSVDHPRFVAPRVEDPQVVRCGL